MAKGKHATALFEVIHQDKRFDRASRRGILPTPKWWFKRRPASDAATPVAPMAASASSPADVGKPRSLHVMTDSSSKQLTLQVSYTSAIISTFTIVVLIVCAYLLGRHAGPGSRPVIASLSTEEMRQLPPQPSVLEIERGNSTRTSLPVNPTTGAVEATLGPAASRNLRPQTFNDPKPPATLVVQDSKRSIGLNYVIVQSYPDEASADEAKNLLISNGILCTVETNLPYAPKWHSVVGITGFDKIKNSREYDAYIKSIDDVGKKFAGNSKFKKFEPKAYKWK
jgi:hypothetical protein